MKPQLPIFFACVLAIFAASGTPASAQGDISQPGGELREQSFGDPNAPVTVIEYASLTCHHCRDFHINTWPAISPASEPMISQPVAISASTWKT